jgi:hypothetical protein
MINKVNMKNLGTSEITHAFCQAVYAQGEDGPAAENMYCQARDEMRKAVLKVSVW